MPLLQATDKVIAELNKRLSALERTIKVYTTELAAAELHIASLEEQLIKFKENRRQLKVVNEQRHTLRKSPERRIGQLLLLPYRLPERLVKTIWSKTRVRDSGATTDYQKWLRCHRASAADLDRMRREARAFNFKPVISIITPVFDTRVPRLREAIESVVAQVYENWELILVDDGSRASELLAELPKLAARDSRISLIKLETNAGISAASNKGLAAAHGEWVAFLDHDDLLEPDALFQVVSLLQKHPDADLIFSDEDKLADTGYEAPVFKPDWSPDFFLSYNYIGHFTAIRRELVEKAGRFRSAFDSAQDYDLFLRVVEHTGRIHHIPRVLYHWRRTTDSSAANIRQKPGQLDASRRAIQEHLKRCNQPAHVGVDWKTHAFWIRRELAEPKKISIVIASRADRAQLAEHKERLSSKTDYPNCEVIIAENRNAAFAKTDSPWLMFLDADVEPINSDWLTIMAEHVQRQEVGAVGGQLLNPNDSVEHAGIVLGIGGIAQPAFRGFPADHRGANRQLAVTRNCSAISSACMLTRREVLEKVSGFDETLPEVLADVDLCLKMRRLGYLLVYTPFVKLRWHGSEQEKTDVTGEAIIRERWAEELSRDPYYNPNLSRLRADFSLGT